MTKAKTPRVAPPQLTPEEQAGMKDFWEVHDARRISISQDLISTLSNHPEFGPLVKQLAGGLESDQDGELERRALLDGDWPPLQTSLITRGASYAQMGLSFHAWYEGIALFRASIFPHLAATYGKNTERLIRAIHSKDLFLDITMSAIGEGYLTAKEQIIRQQQQAIREISTPALLLREGLVIMPLIGLLDSHRAQQVTEQLLGAIRTHRARVVVMDITGVPTVDSAVANYLLQSVEAARLMGAQAIVTGLSADIAQTLVRIGVDLTRLSTKGDLQSGVEAAERILAV